MAVTTPEEDRLVSLLIFWGRSCCGCGCCCTQRTHEIAKALTPLMARTEPSLRAAIMRYEAAEKAEDDFNETAAPDQRGICSDEGRRLMRERMQSQEDARTLAESLEP